MNKKIIFVGNYWPYVNGGTRIFRVAPILSEMGYEVHVFTMPLKAHENFGNIIVHEVPYKGDIFTQHRRIFKKFLSVKTEGTNIGLRDMVLESSSEKSKILERVLSRCFLLYKEIFGFPDTEKRWKHDLSKAMTDFFNENSSEDLIVFSEYPVISHIVVSKLKNKFNFTWIADFVDLWSMNTNYPFGFIRRLFDRALEKKTLRHADIIMTTSRIWADNLRYLHKNKDVYFMPHGFENGLLQEFKNKSDNRKTFLQKESVQIIYAGRFYPNEDLAIFFEAFADLVKKNAIPDYTIQFYSPDGRLIKMLAKQFSIEKFVEVIPPVPRNILLDKMRKADLLLVAGVNNYDNSLSGCVPSKIYDYIVVGKPILVAGGVKGDEIEDLITKGNIGEIALTSEECKQFLERQNNYFKENGFFKFEPNYEELLNFSQESEVSRLISFIQNHSKKTD